MTYRLLLLLALLLACPAAGRASTIQDMRAACHVGSAPTPPGSMPTSMAGVTVVSPAEAKCALDRFKDIVLIAPQLDLQQIPGATPIASLATPPDSREGDARFVPALQKLTGGDLNRPVMVYCHHTSCGYSYNAALHLRRLGYKQILWLREGLKGWAQAGYKFAPFEAVRAPLDTQPAVMWFKAASDQTMGCFGKKNPDACDLKLAFEEKASRDPSLKPEERERIYSEMFNTAAVRAQNLRESGKAQEGYDGIQRAYAVLMDYADGGAKIGVLSSNAKVLREYALASLAAGRPQDAANVLATARRDGAAQYKRLASFAKGSNERKAVLQSGVSMEHLERDVAEFAAERATDLYGDGKSAQAAVYRHMTDDAVDQAARWIRRNGREGIKSMMDLEPEYRLAEVKLLQAEVAKAARDNDAVVRNLSVATYSACAVADPDAVNALLKGQQVKLEVVNSAHQCIEAGQSLQAATSKPLSIEIAKREYERYIASLGD